MEMQGILAGLPSLTSEDQRKVRDVCESLLKSEIGGSVNGSTTESVVYNALVSSLSARGLSSFPTLPGFRRRRAYKFFKDSLPEVDRMVRAVPGLAREEWKQFVGLVVECLVRDLDQRGVPLGFYSVATNLHRISEAFSREFPGYMESGMAGLLLSVWKEQGAPLGRASLDDDDEV